mmetsp:Transcript_49034/g.110250  ORF Transcript_49034/g.110250 Transcript_49034/m.110250 type:complete len:647 (-) Transcript_49034:72-2012(-)
MLSRALTSGARLRPAQHALFRSPHALVGAAVPSIAGARRSFAFNIYDDQPQADRKYKGTPKEVAEAIFLQHSGDGTSIAPGATFKAACSSLAQEYQQLSALTNVALEGRAFSLMDQNESGMLDLEDFVLGVDEMLNPTQQKYKHLAERLQAGNVAKVEADFSHIKRVAIVGGGVAGLQTARALSKIGKECTIFEKTDNVGGVWRANYADFGLQVPMELYEFPEFPYPEDVKWEKFPPGPQVQQYIERYVEHFGLEKLCRFGTGVHAIVPRGDGQRGWKLRYGKKGEEIQEEEFDYVVAATGMYGWPPHIPTVRGQEEFKGEILHSCTFQDRKVAAGKKVITVGGGKSAIDNAVSAAKEGKSSTLLFRSAHWPVPRLLANLVPFKWGTYSRFGHFMCPVHWDISPYMWYLHALMTPVKWVWWRIVELMFKVQFKLPKELTPSTPIEVDLFTGGQIITYEFRDHVREGKVKAVRGSLEKFVPDGVVLGDGTKLEADLVIFGTGFTKHYGLLDRLVQNKLELHVDGLYLYRNIIPARLPDFAFIGSEVSTFNNILTHGLQAEWLARVLDGKITLPTERRMQGKIEKEQAWKRTWMPPTSARASIFQLHMMKYHDTLVTDMGENPKRKGFNLLAELFSPYCARDYAKLFK